MKWFLPFLDGLFTFLPTSPINFLIGVPLSSINCDTLPIAKHMFSSPGAHECCSLCSSPTSWLLWLGGVCGHFWPSGLGVGVICVTCTSEHLIVGARVFRAFSFFWSNDFQCSRRCWLTSCSSWVPEWFCWVESFSDILWSTCTLN